MLRKMASTLLSLTAALTLSISTFMAPAAPAVAANASGDPEGDIAKMYRVKHELKFNMKGTSATLDGKAVYADKPILKEGRVFVPLRTLQESGAAISVTWDAKKREAHVVMKPQVAPALQELTFRIGSDQVYLAGGIAVTDEKIPKPFLANGRTYIPVKSLAWLGISPSLNNGTVTWNWSEKIIEVLTPNWETEGETTTFSMLYQEDMYTPQFLYSFGSGGWGGGTGTVTAKGIELDGRKYNRMEFNADLRPGMNPLKLYAISAGTADFTVLRKISDPGVVPVRLTEEGQQYITMDRPASGYLKAKSREEISVKGTIVKPNEHFDQVTVAVQKYAPKTGGLGHEVYTTVSSSKLPIQDNNFSGAIQVDGPGYYLIFVISPGYLAAPGGPMSTVWAEFIVEVE